MTSTAASPCSQPFGQNHLFGMSDSVVRNMLYGYSFSKSLMHVVGEVETTKDEMAT